jgi:hypothetical protein
MATKKTDVVLNPEKVTWRKASSGEALEASGVLLDYKKSKFEVAEFFNAGCTAKLVCCTEPVLVDEKYRSRRDHLGRLCITPRGDRTESLFFRGRTEEECKRVGLGLWFGYLLGVQAIGVQEVLAVSTLMLADAFAPPDPADR